MLNSQFVSAENFFLASQQAKINHLKALMSSLHWVEVTCDLIHELQRERGISNAFLVSKDTSLSGELSSRRQACDSAQEAFKTALQALLDTANAANISPSLFNAIAAALSSLGTLEMLRESIDRQDIMPVESTQAYIGMIESLMLIVFDVADHATDPLVTQSLSALFSLIQLKEYIGQERAWTVIGFSRGRFVARLLDRLQRLKTTQANVREYLGQSAGKTLSEAINALENSPVANELHQLRAMRDALTEDQSVNADIAEVWYQKSTAYIDQLHAIEVKTMHGLLDVCQSVIARAKQRRTYAQQQLSELKNTPDIPTSKIPNDSLPTPSVQSLIDEQQKQIQTLKSELTNAKQALEARKLIERAKSLLMSKLSLKEDDAFRRLQKSAMDQNKSLEQVAQIVIATLQTMK